jgi:periplasmic divalent cation tolerance protein
MTTSPESPIVLVTTVIDDREVAERIARELVGARLAACVQLSPAPVTSVYRWPDEQTGEPEIQSEQEWTVTAKTTASRALEAVDAIRTTHTYDVPEILVTPVIGGYGPYLEWISREFGMSQSGNS